MTDTPLEIPSLGSVGLSVMLGQGQDCVLVQIVHYGQLQAGIVLTPEGAEAMARSLNERARLARLPLEPADV
jgi:hypothetical protein